jgi:hypothetical protein
MHTLFEWKSSQILHTISVYSNPLRSQTRKNSFQLFLNQFKHTSNIKLYIVEIAYGDRPFEIPHDNYYNVIQLRAKDIVWTKENAINVAVSHLPSDWKYAAYIDGDFHFTREDWALEAIEKMQHYDWVQLFSGYAFMTADYRPMWCRPSFAYCYHNYFKCDRNKLAAVAQPLITSSSDDIAYSKSYNGPNIGAVGGAWAWTKESFENVCGMIDFCVLGSGDLFTALGLVGCPFNNREEIIHCDPAYVNSIIHWTDNAYNVVRGNIGYIDNFITHTWHGDLRNRGYETRWKILEDNKFDPNADICYDDQGLVIWKGNKSKLRDDVRQYFLSRNEDSSYCSYEALY